MPQAAPRGGRDGSERRDVLEAAVGERRAVEALGRGLPVELAVEPVVVVVAGVGGDRGVRGREVREVLAVEHLGLEGRPEGLDLAVRPGRVDLGPDVADRRARRGVRWKRLSIVRTIATKGVPLSVISSCGTPHSSIASPRASRIGSASLVGHRPDAEQEPAVVVDEGDEVAGARPPVGVGR